MYTLTDLRPKATALAVVPAALAVVPLALSLSVGSPFCRLKLRRVDMSPLAFHRLVEFTLTSVGPSCIIVLFNQ